MQAARSEVKAEQQRVVELQDELHLQKRATEVQTTLLERKRAKKQGSAPWPINQLVCSNTLRGVSTMSHRSTKIDLGSEVLFVFSVWLWAPST